MKKIKEIKIVNQDGSTEIADIGAEAVNVDYNDTTVKAELDKLNTDNSTNKNNIASLSSSVSKLASGSPAGIYATVAALTSADPDHSRIYVVTADGHWYYYNSGWQDGGIYLAAVDTTTDAKLTDSIKAANSKTAGDYLKILDEKLFDNSYKEYDMYSLPINFTSLQSTWVGDDGVVSSNGNYCTNYIYSETFGSIYASELLGGNIVIDVWKDCNKENPIIDNHISGTRISRYSKSTIPTTENEAINFFPGCLLIIVYQYYAQAKNKVKIKGIDDKTLLNNNLKLNNNQLSQIEEDLDIIDNTLSISGKAAESKITGESLQNLENSLFDNLSWKTYDGFNTRQNIYKIFTQLDNTFISFETGKVSENNNYRSFFVYCVKPLKIYATSYTSQSLWFQIWKNCDVNNIYQDNFMTGELKTLYPKSDIPTTEEDAIIVNRGEVLVIVMQQYQMYTNVFEINYNTDLLNNNLKLNNNQLSQVNKKMLISKSGDNFYFYIPSKYNKNYLRFYFSKFNAPKNSEYWSWKFINCYIVDEDFDNIINVTLAQEMEWDSVVKINGESDYISGVHGYESTQRMNILFNNNLIDNTTADFDKIECGNIKILVDSEVYDHNENLSFNKLKIIEINENEMTTYVKWKALTSCRLNEYYASMCSSTYTTVQYARNGLNYITTDVHDGIAENQNWLSRVNTDTMEGWGNYFGYKMWLEGKFETLIAFGTKYGLYSKSYISAIDSVEHDLVNGSTFEGKTHYNFTF